MRVNCWVADGAKVTGVGVIARELRLAAVTVADAVPDTPLRVAVMVAVPPPTGVKMPLDPVALLIVATPEAEVVQVTVEEISWVVESEYVPIAVIC